MSINHFATIFNGKTTTMSYTIDNLPEVEQSDIWARMEKGDKYLTAVYGNWKPRINLDTLDMGSASKCIIAQLEGNFWKFVDCRNGRNTD